MTYLKQRQGAAPFLVARFGKDREAWALLRFRNASALAGSQSEYVELFADPACETQIGYAPSIYEMRKVARRFFYPEFHHAHPLLKYAIDLWDELLCINYLPFWQGLRLLLTAAFLLAFAGSVIVLPTVASAIFMLNAPTVAGKAICLAMALSWPPIIGLTMRRKGGLLDRFCERATQVMESRTFDRWVGGPLLVVLVLAIAYSYVS